ncbi:MAG: hypothetical protein MMC33_006922 [Icmadophila ericetorum]|nr:hypothetical protein [Icmadophila ericetorum]
MARISTRNLVNNETSADAATTIFHNSPDAAATDEDRRNWRGFCEVESEPAFFNVMLKEFGVKGVKVQEVVSLDDEILAYLPRPVYGLIFLFKWREDDPVKQEATCPPGVWFANQVQTIDNACASVALLNIVNNIPNIDLGENLQQFKDFTRVFTPALRGEAIGNFEFVRQIHNSFARKTDMLNADLCLKNAAASRRRKNQSKSTDVEEESSFHFIAFVPIEGRVWKLDGLERQPHSLGAITEDDWLTHVKPNIEARMADYDDGQLEFAILGLVHDRTIRLKQSLATNVKSIQAMMNQLGPNVEAVTAVNGGSNVLEGALTGPNGEYELTQEAIDDSSPLAADRAGTEPSAFVSSGVKLKELCVEQTTLRASLREELEAARFDQEKAASRRHDYGPIIQLWLRSHARQSAIKAMVGTASL